MEDHVELLFSQRPEWADVKPISQTDDSVNPVAPILYNEEYKDVTDYFRGVVKTGEKSKRVLDLTAAVIALNPAHYSAWQYRYQTLIAIKSDLSTELALMDEIATKHLKTYQVWHHRRLLITLIGASALANELLFVAKILRVDAKNYHTWSYRQWLLAHFNDKEVWKGETPFVEEMIEEDVRNNSAWHHRFFVVFQSGVHDSDEVNRDDVARRELLFVKSKIALAPNNASAWNYLRGILDHTKTPYASLTSFIRPFTVSHAEHEQPEVVDLENPPPSEGAELPCPLALEFMADIYEQTGGESTKLAVQLWSSLADKHDTVRNRYWDFRKQEALQAVV